MTYGNTTQLKAIIIDSLQSRLALGMFKVFSRTGPPILGAAKSAIFQTALGPVSYTHLTLPTIYSV